MDRERWGALVASGSASGRIVLIGVALALVSCKASLAHHDDRDNGGNGGASSIHPAGGNGGAPGGGGNIAATGGAGGARDGGATGSGGIPLGSGGTSGTAGPGSGGAGGHAGSGSGGASGASGGAGGSVAVCTPMDTRCTPQGMQTCSNQGAWGATTACESTICSGTKCLPKAAVLVVTYDAVFTYDATNGAFSSSFDFNETHLYASALGPDGKLWLADDKANTIVHYDLSGASLGVFAPLPDYCAAMAFGPDGNIYVSTQATPRESIVRINGATGASMGTFLQGPLDCNIGGMAFHNGSLFVTWGDARNGKVYQYDGTSGAQVAVLYDTVDEPNGPRTPVFDPDGNMYVPIWQTTHIATFNPTVNATTFKFADYLSVYPTYPKSVAVQPDGRLLVLTDPSDELMRYDPKTRVLTTLPTRTGTLGRGRAIYYRGP